MIIITTTELEDEEEEDSIDKMMLTKIENQRKVTLKTTRMITHEEEEEAEEAEREEVEVIIIEVTIKEVTIKEKEVTIIKKEATICLEKDIKNKSSKKFHYLSILLLSKTHIRGRKDSKKRSLNNTMTKM